MSLNASLHRVLERQGLWSPRAEPKRVRESRNTARRVVIGQEENNNDGDPEPYARLRIAGHGASITHLSPHEFPQPPPRAQKTRALPVIFVVPPTKSHRGTSCTRGDGSVVRARRHCSRRATVPEYWSRTDERRGYALSRVFVFGAQ